MKTALLMISIAFSFSALARPEIDRMKFDRELTVQTRDVAKANCPKEAKPQFRVTFAHYEVSERVAR